MCSLAIGFGDITPGNRYVVLPFADTCSSFACSPGARVFDIIFIAIGIFNLALAITTIRGVVSESIHQAAKRRRRRAARNRLRRERVRVNLRAPEFVYHGGGRRAVDHTNDELHAAAPSASIFRTITDAIRFKGRPRTSDDDDDSDSNLGLDHPHDADRIPEEDQHLLLPRAADPEYDAEYRKEVDYHDKRDRFLQVCVSPSGYHSPAYLTPCAHQISFAFLAFVSWWLIGGLVFSLTEGWGFGSAMYFCACDVIQEFHPRD